MRAFASQPNRARGRAATGLARSNTTSPRAAAPTLPLLHWQRTLGNQAVLAMLQARAGNPQARPSGGEPSPGLVPSLVDEVLAAPGRPLDPTTRAFMEPRFGQDFSQVRIHTDAKAAESARRVNARAYTVGQHVVLGEGQPSSATTEGRQLLAHELAHVVQQGRGGPAPELDPSAPHEQDAHAAATAVAAGRPSVQVACGTGAGLARSNGGPGGGGPPPEGMTMAEIDAEIIKQRHWLDQIAQAWNEAVLEPAGDPAPPQPHRPVRARPEVQAPRVSRGGVEERLRGIAQRGGPRASEAQGTLEDIATARARIAELQAERAARATRQQAQFQAPTRGTPAKKAPSDPAKPPPATAISKPTPKKDVTSKPGKSPPATPAKPPAKLTTSIEVFVEAISSGTKPTAPPAPAKGHLAPTSPPAKTTVGEITVSKPTPAPTTGTGPKPTVTSGPTEGQSKSPTGPSSAATTLGKGPAAAPATQVSKGASSAPPAPAPAASPARPAPTPATPATKPAVVSASELRMDLRQGEVETRRMVLVTQGIKLFLGVWNAYQVLLDAFKATNLAAATLAGKGTPFDKQIQEARDLEARAKDVEQFYSTFDVIKDKYPDKNRGEPEPLGWYELKQTQLAYLVIERHLHDALEEVKTSQDDLVAQSDELSGAMARIVTAAALMPVSEVLWAEAMLFADAGGKMNTYLGAALSHYSKAQQSLEKHRRWAQAAVWNLELRLRELGQSGVFSKMSPEELKAAPLDKFTLRR